MKTKKRIGFLTGSRLSPNMVAVLSNLGKMLSQEFDFSIITSKKNDNKILRKYYKIHYYTASRIDFKEIRSDIKGCINYVETEAPDLLVNIIDPHTLGLSVVIAGKFKNIKTVIRMTGDTYGFVDWPNPWKRFKQWLLNYKMATFAYRNGDHIITVGKTLADSLIKKGINHQKITVLPQPFDPSRFKAVSYEEKQKLKLRMGLLANKKLILYVGRFSWYKGTDILLDIVNMILKISEKFQFCLIGNGEYDKQLENYTNSLVVKKTNVEYDKIVNYYQVADLLLFPSRTEGLPNTILEALSCSIPVVATSVGEIPNYVSNIANSCQEFVEFILSENWKIDRLPPDINYQYLKNAYASFFNNVISANE